MAKEIPTAAKRGAIELIKSHKERFDIEEDDTPPSARKGEEVIQTKKRKRVEGQALQGDLKKAVVEGKAKKTDGKVIPTFKGKYSPYLKDLFDVSEEDWKKQKVAQKGVEEGLLEKKREKDRVIYEPAKEDISEYSQAEIENVLKPAGVVKEVNKGKSPAKKPKTSRDKGYDPRMGSPGLEGRGVSGRTIQEKKQKEDKPSNLFEMFKGEIKDIGREVKEKDPIGVLKEGAEAYGKGYLYGSTAIIGGLPGYVGSVVGSGGDLEKATKSWSETAADTEYGFVPSGPQFVKQAEEIEKSPEYTGLEEDILARTQAWGAATLSAPESVFRPESPDLVEAGIGLTGKGSDRRRDIDVAFYKKYPSAIAPAAVSEYLFGKGVSKALSGAKDVAGKVVPYSDEMGKALRGVGGKVKSGAKTGAYKGLKKTIGEEGIETAAKEGTAGSIVKKISPEYARFKLPKEVGEEVTTGFVREGVGEATETGTKKQVATLSDDVTKMFYPQVDEPTKFSYRIGGFGKKETLKMADEPIWAKVKDVPKKFAAYKGPKGGVAKIKTHGGQEIVKFLDPDDVSKGLPTYKVAVGEPTETGAKRAGYALTGEVEQLGGMGIQREALETGGKKITSEVPDIAVEYTGKTTIPSEIGATTSPISRALLSRKSGIDKGPKLKEIPEPGSKDIEVEREITEEEVTGKMPEIGFEVKEAAREREKPTPRPFTVMKDLPDFDETPRPLTEETPKEREREKVAPRQKYRGRQKEKTVPRVTFAEPTGVGVPMKAPFRLPEFEGKPPKKPKKRDTGRIEGELVEYPIGDLLKAFIGERKGKKFALTERDLEPKSKGKDIKEFGGGLV